MNANNNNEMSQELSAYLDGELNEADTAKVDEALGKNPELMRELNQLKHTREMLRNLPETTAPDGFAARVMAAAEKNATRRSSTKIPVWLWGSGVAAAVIILAVTVSYYSLLVKKETTSIDKIAQQQGEPKKIGELARDLKADNELDFSRAKGKIPAGKRPTPSVPEERTKPATRTTFLAKDSDTKMVRGLKSNVTHKKTAVGSPKDAMKSGLKVESDDRYEEQEGVGGVRQRLDGKSVAKLAAVNRRTNNQDVWTDNIKAEKKNVEKILTYNGLQIVPETQEVLESNQAMNLSSNQIYNSNIGRAVAVNGNEVEYLVYGSPEQVSAISKELRGKVQMRQRVSQLPEDTYRNAILTNADSGGVTAAEDKDTAEERSRGVSIGIAAKSLAESTKTAAPLKDASEASPETLFVMGKQKLRTRESEIGRAHV